MAKLYQRALAFLSPKTRPLLLDSLKQYRLEVKTIHKSYSTAIDDLLDVYMPADFSDDLPRGEPRMNEFGWKAQIAHNLERLRLREAAKDLEARDNKIIHDFLLRHQLPRS